jgi:hypothetical protein
MEAIDCAVPTVDDIDPIAVMGRSNGEGRIACRQFHHESGKAEKDSGMFGNNSGECGRYEWDVCTGKFTEVAHGCEETIREGTGDAGIVDHDGCESDLVVGDGGPFDRLVEVDDHRGRV